MSAAPLWVLWRISASDRVIVARESTRGLAIARAAVEFRLEPHEIGLFVRRLRDPGGRCHDHHRTGVAAMNAPQEDPILVARRIDDSGEFVGYPRIIAAAPRAELVDLASRRYQFTPRETETFDLCGACYVADTREVVRIVDRLGGAS